MPTILVFVIPYKPKALGYVQFKAICYVDLYDW